MDDSVLSVHHLSTYFFTREGTVKAVRDVSFSLPRHRIVGLVGESGAGKSVTALSILRLVPFPGRVVSGSVYFQGRDLLQLSAEELRQVRGKEIGVIFQNPTSALNPVLDIGTQVSEVVSAHMDVSQREAHQRMLEVLAESGLANAEEVAASYPHQLSGGMAQRVMVAMAMALRPAALIADEPTSALDVTVQAALLDSLQELRVKHGSSLLLITHDLAVVAKMADEVVVMYAGTLVEYADVSALFQNPAHPYTVGLLQSRPRLDRSRGRLQAIKGMPPSMVDPPDECPFLPRCPKATMQCRTNPSPKLEPLRDNHSVACYNPVLPETVSALL